MLAIALILSPDERVPLARLFGRNVAVVIGSDAARGRHIPMRLPDRPYDEPRPVRGRRRRQRRTPALKPKGRRAR